MASVPRGSARGSILLQALEVGVTDLDADDATERLHHLGDVARRQHDVVREEDAAPYDERHDLARALVEDDVLDLADLLVRVEAPDRRVLHDVNLVGRLWEAG